MNKTEHKATIYYRYIDDYLSREEKLRLVSETQSFFVTYSNEILTA